MVKTTFLKAPQDARKAIEGDTDVQEEIAEVKVTVRIRNSRCVRVTLEQAVILNFVIESVLQQGTSNTTACRQTLAEEFSCRIRPLITPKGLLSLSTSPSSFDRLRNQHLRVLGRNGAPAQLESLLLMLFDRVGPSENLSDRATASIPQRFRCCALAF